MSLVAVVASRTGKIIKNDLKCFWKRKRICYKMVYNATLCIL